MSHRGSPRKQRQMRNQRVSKHTVWMVGLGPWKKRSQGMGGGVPQGRNREQVLTPRVVWKAPWQGQMSRKQRSPLYGCLGKSVSGREDGEHQDSNVWAGLVSEGASKESCELEQKPVIGGVKKGCQGESWGQNPQGHGGQSVPSSLPTAAQDRVHHGLTLGAAGRELCWGIQIWPTQPGGRVGRAGGEHTFLLLIKQTSTS